MMYIPGLSQLVHGEKTEAAIVAGLTYGGMAAVRKIDPPQTCVDIIKILSLTNSINGLNMNYHKN